MNTYSQQTSTRYHIIHAKKLSVYQRHEVMNRAQCDRELRRRYDSTSHPVMQLGLVWIVLNEPVRQPLLCHNYRYTSS